jgi:hypothetical protein
MLAATFGYCVLNGLPRKKDLRKKLVILIPFLEYLSLAL